MPENPALDSPSPSSRLLVWWANHSHRYVVPIVGAVSVSLGVSLAIDSSIPWRTYTPPLLVLVGAGTLASGLAALAIRRSHAARAAAAAVAAVSAPMGSLTTCSDYLPEPFAPGAGARVPMPALVRGAASPDSTITIPSDPGEYLWRSWSTPSTHLLVDLVGPVPETAYRSWGNDEPVLYEEGEPIFVGAPSGLTPSGGNGPLPLREGASISSEYMSTTRLLGTDPDGAVQFPGWTDTVSSGGPPSYSASRIANPVHHEALNPTPPHLRPRPSPARNTLPGHHPHPASIQRGVRCATCHTSVTDPPKWRRCLDCQRHLCADCVVSALLTYQRGWCATCAAARNPELASDRPSRHPSSDAQDVYAPMPGESDLPATGLAS
ncbi:MAG: hypothetical protein WB809_02010 [Thermoplasmata archaeon]